MPSTASASSEENAKGIFIYMRKEYARKLKEQCYFDEEKGEYLPRRVDVDIDLLSDKDVQHELLKMMHYLDASVGSINRTLNKGISATPYDFAEWMDSLGGCISEVRDEVRNLYQEQVNQTRALNRIAAALETTDSQQRNNTCRYKEDFGGDFTEEEWEEFNDALKRND